MYNDPDVSLGFTPQERKEAIFTMRRRARSHRSVIEPENRVEKAAVLAAINVFNVRPKTLGRMMPTLKQMREEIDSQIPKIVQQQVSQIVKDTSGSEYLMIRTPKTISYVRQTLLLPEVQAAAVETGLSPEIVLLLSLGWYPIDRLTPQGLRVLKQLDALESKNKEIILEMALANDRFAREFGRFITNPYV